MKPSILLLLLLALGAAQAQVPADWDKWVADGIADDDNSDYKESERLLGQACDFSIAAALGSERLAKACLELAATHAMRGRYEHASKVLEELLEVWEDSLDVRAVDRVNLLIEAADVASARGAFALTSKHLDEAGELALGLDWIDQALVLRRVALYHTSKSARDKGNSLLLGAAATLRKVADWQDAEFLHAAEQVGRSLFVFGLHEQSWQFLEPAVEQGRSRARTVPDYDETWQQYLGTAHIAQLALTHVDKDRGKLLKQELESWPRRPEEGVSKPRLAAKVEPSFTKGARGAAAQGVVILSVEVWPDGRAHNIEAVEPLPYGLTWQAMGVIRRWKFAPGVQGGQPVKVQAQIEIHFRLK